MKYIIIDSNAVIHRAFHALPPFSAPDGSPTGAVYGFTSILIKIFKDLKPDFILAAFDTAAPTFRHVAYEKYKAQRERAPDELYQQFPKVKEVLTAFNIPVLEKDGFEADDIIGTLAKKIIKEDKNAEIIIVTGDADAFQLVDKNVSVFTMRKGITDTVLYDEEAVRERFGFGPKTLIDYKALRGDPSDNIPGVKGVGEKTATELLKKYGNLENIYKLLKKKKLPEPVSLLEKLKISEDEAILSKSLATINVEVDINISFKNLSRPNIEVTAGIKSVLEKFGFKSLLARLSGESGVSKSQHKQVLPFSPAAASVAVKTAGYKELQKLFHNEQIAMVFKEGDDSVLVADKKNIFKASIKEVGRIDKEILEDCQKIIFDVKPFIKYLLKEQGVFLERNFFDLKIAGFLLGSDARDITVERLLSLYLQENTEENINKEVSINKFFELRGVLEKKLKEVNSWFIFSEVESLLIPGLSQMENTGIKVDSTHLAKTSAFFKKNLDKLTREVYKEAGEEFNINSSQQLSEILFKKLEIRSGDKKIKKTHGGKLSTDQEQLLELQYSHPIIKKIIEYREIAKLKSTYSDTLPGLISKDGRIHTSFDQTGAVTGRLSSRDPNLQNIPVKTLLGKEIRRSFMSEAGYVLVSFDYSQLELRIAAELADDKKMLEAFSRGEDIHTLTASEINNVPLDKVTSEMRRAAKTLNFGILYGMGIRAFIKGSGFSESDAKKFYEEYFRDFSGIKDYIQRTIEFARENGYVETYFGRRRYLSGLSGVGFRTEREQERMAINMPIQGTAADVVKMAMIKVFQLLRSKYNENEVRLLLQIHDELLFEIADRKDLINSAIKDIKAAMESIWKGVVILKVDVKTGKNWADLE